MTAVPKRIAIKFNLKNTPSVQPTDIVPVFQRWIQEHSVEGLLIDVIDYKHVANGPGVILIADEGDYGYDLADGQVGLQYLRKRFLPDTLTEAIQQVFRLALQAAQKLEAEGLDGIEFEYSSAKISFLDRRLYRNTSETFEAVQSEPHEILSHLYGTNVELTRQYDDPREVFAIAYQVEDEVNLEQLTHNLKSKEFAV